MVFAYSLTLVMLWAHVALILTVRLSRTALIGSVYHIPYLRGKVAIQLNIVVTALMASFVTITFVPKQQRQQLQLHLHVFQLEMRVFVPVQMLPEQFAVKDH